MNDWGMSVLVQYPFTVRSARKIRGALLCETDKGLYLLQEYRGALGRLESEYRLLLYLQEQSSVAVDAITKTGEGLLLAKNEEDTSYVLKQWYPWNECSVNSIGDLRQAVRGLAELHCRMRGYQDAEPVDILPMVQEQEESEQRAGEDCDAAWLQETQKSVKNRQDSCEKPYWHEICEKHNRELKRVRAYLQKKKQKSVLEQLIQKSYDRMYEQAREACMQLALPAYRELQEEARNRHDRIHGAFHQHNVLIGNNKTAVVNFEQSAEGCQLEDLYQFLRKVLEKQNWNPDTGLRLIEEYCRILPLSAREQKALGWMIAYPEKYWKQVNFYFNNNKSWIADKNIEKLKKAVEQESVRTAFAGLLIK